MKAMKATIDEVDDYVLKKINELLVESVNFLKENDFEKFEECNIKIKTYNDIFDFIYKCGIHNKGE